MPNLIFGSIFKVAISAKNFDIQSRFSFRIGINTFNYLWKLELQTKVTKKEKLWHVLKHELHVKVLKLNLLTSADSN